MEGSVILQAIDKLIVNKIKGPTWGGDADTREAEVPEPAPGLVPAPVRGAKDHGRKEHL